VIDSEQQFVLSWLSCTGTHNWAFTQYLFKINYHLPVRRSDQCWSFTNQSIRSHLARKC